MMLMRVKVTFSLCEKSEESNRDTGCGENKLRYTTGQSSEARVLIKRAPGIVRYKYRERTSWSK